MARQSFRSCIHPVFVAAVDLTPRYLPAFRAGPHLSRADAAESVNRGTSGGRAPPAPGDQMGHHCRFASTPQAFAEDNGGSSLSHRCFDRVVVLGGNESVRLRNHGGAAADTFGKTIGETGKASLASLQEATVEAATGDGGTHGGRSSSGNSGSGNSSSSSNAGEVSRQTSRSGIAGEYSKDAAAPIDSRSTSSAGTMRRDNVNPSVTSMGHERHGGCMDEAKTGLLEGVRIRGVRDGGEGRKFHDGRRQNRCAGKADTDERRVDVLSDEGGGGGMESGGNASDRNGDGEEIGEGPVEEEERKEGSVEARVSGHVHSFLYLVLRYLDIRWFVSFQRRLARFSYQIRFLVFCCGRCSP